MSSHSVILWRTNGVRAFQKIPLLYFFLLFCFVPKERCLVLFSFFQDLPAAFTLSSDLTERHSRWHPPRVLSSDEQLKWRSLWPRPSARRETQKGVETERQTMVGVEPYFLATGHTAQQPTIHTAQQPPSPATGPPCAVSSLHLCACSKARPRSSFSETFPHPVIVEVAVV